MIKPVTVGFVAICASKDELFVSKMLAKVPSCQTQTASLFAVSGAGKNSSTLYLATLSYFADFTL